MTSRRSGVAAVSMACAVVAFRAVLAIWCAPTAAGAGGIKVRIFSGTDEHWVPFHVARQKGYFADEGLDVEVTVFTTGTTAVEAFRAGHGDFVSAGDLPSSALWQGGNVI